LHSTSSKTVSKLENAASSTPCNSSNALVNNA
jgi:hypothetical protein